MLRFLSISISSASLRYFSFEIGRGDFGQLKKNFSLNYIVCALIGLIILLLAETIDLWFVNNKLVIAEDRKIAALLYLYYKLSR
jgi:Na+-driven multidrug efflux pump